MQARPEKKRTFFVSRTGADKEWAQWIAQESEAAGHSAIVQDWDSRPGKSFSEFMRKGRASAAGSPAAEAHLDEAIRHFRSAGSRDLPLGLLYRAAHFRQTREFDKTKHDLDEVRILATRCGMRLFLADYHLEQARLFLAQQRPEEARPHYESARSLINETGYHRRDPELAELEVMSKTVATPSQ